MSLTIARLAEIHKALSIGQPSIDALTVYVAPREPGLVLVDAPAGESERVLTRLEEIQPLIQSLIAIAPQPLGPLPSWPAADAAPDVQLAHPASRVLTFTRLLTTDAARCWDEKDYQGAADRLTAPLRWANQLLTPGAERWVSLRGQQCLSNVLLRLQTQTAAGLATHLDGPRRASLLEALAAFDATDPTGTVAAWEASARGNLASARAMFAGADAGEKLAIHIDTYGVNSENPEGLAEKKDVFTGGFLIRSDLDKVRTMPAAAIAKNLDAAEAMITSVAAALRSPDSLGALKPLQVQAAADPSQIARIVLGSPAATLDNNRTTAKLLSDCMERLAAPAK